MLFPVIGMVFQQADGAINLFAEQQSGESVRQGQTGKAQQVEGFAFQFGVESARAANQERRVVARPHPFPQGVGKLSGGEVAPLFVQRDDALPRAAQGLPDAGFLRRLYLRAGLAAGGFGFDFDDAGREFARQAFQIFIATVLYPRGLLVTDGDDAEFHGLADAALSCIAGVLGCPGIDQRSSRL